MFGGPQMTQQALIQAMMNQRMAGQPQSMPQGLASLYSSRFGGQMPQAGQATMPQQMPMPVRQGAMVPQSGMRPQMGMGAKGQPGGMTGQAGSFIQDLIRQRMAQGAMRPALPQAAAPQAAAQVMPSVPTDQSVPQVVAMYRGGYV